MPFRMSSAIKYDELHVGKLQTARRQLETAVSLFFQHGDPVSIHTLTCAAYNVIRDINNSRDGSPMFAKQYYVNLEDKPSLSDFNEPENFFKHANRDPDAVLTFYPKFTECLLIDACEKYLNLTGDHVVDFIVFIMWFTSRAPEKYDIPEGWDSFVATAKDLHQSNDRRGFHRWVSDHLPELPLGTFKKKA